MIPKQVEEYHRFHTLISEGDYYRLSSYLENHEMDAWMVVSKDKKEALVTVMQVLRQPNAKDRILPLAGLDPDLDYHMEMLPGREDQGIQNPAEKESLERLGRPYSGDLLMQAGILVPRGWGDFRSNLFYLHA